MKNYFLLCFLCATTSMGAMEIRFEKVPQLAALAARAYWKSQKEIPVKENEEVKEWLLLHKPGEMKGIGTRIELAYCLKDEKQISYELNVLQNLEISSRWKKAIHDYVTGICDPFNRAYDIFEKKVNSDFERYKQMMNLNACDNGELNDKLKLYIDLMQAKYLIERASWRSSGQTLGIMTGATALISPFSLFLHYFFK